MKFSLDRYAYLDSCVHRWEQTSKIIALIALIFAFAFVSHAMLLPVMLFVTVVLYYLAGLPPNFLLTKLRYPGLLLVTIICLLPFVSGSTPLYHWQWLTIYQEGCIDAILIVTRFICILTLSLIWLGTTPFFQTIKAFRSLGLSPVIVDIMLLAYRYLADLNQNLKNMQTAMKLRGFQANRFSWKYLNRIAGLTGSLLVRSYEQSQRVYQAMILRGYGYQLAPQPAKIWQTGLKFNNFTDIVLFIFCLTGAIVLIGLELFL